jgi:hypothetical protein
MEKLGFRPNPAYKPKSYEETVLHALNGIIMMDLQGKRLAQITATVTQQVEFGHGLIGSLKEGGTIEMKRTRLSPGIWKTSSTRFDINGRMLLFKTISKKQDETQSDFQPVSPDTSIEQALKQVTAN